MGKPGASQNYEVSLKGDLAMIDEPKGSASRPNARKVIRLRLNRTLIIATVALLGGLVGVSVGSNAAQATSGNNGDIKIHEKGTPSGTESNDPKVCEFNVESFNLDSGQTGYLVFNTQGGDKPTGVDAGPYNFGPANVNGYFASQYFDLENGHYKATLYGKMLPGGKLVDVKAKSKVFKVDCNTTPPPTTVPPTTVPPTTVPPTTVPPTTVPPTTTHTVPPTTVHTTPPTTHTTPPTTVKPPKFPVAAHTDGAGVALWQQPITWVLTGMMFMFWALFGPLLVRTRRARASRRH